MTLSFFFDLLFKFEGRATKKLSVIELSMMYKNILNVINKEEVIITSSFLEISGRSTLLFTKHTESFVREDPFGKNGFLPRDCW